MDECPNETEPQEGYCDLCKTYADDLETDTEGREVCGGCREGEGE